MLPGAIFDIRVRKRSNISFCAEGAATAYFGSARRNARGRRGEGGLDISAEFFRFAFVEAEIAEVC